MDFEEINKPKNDVCKSVCENDTLCVCVVCMLYMYFVACHDDKLCRTSACTLHIYINKIMTAMMQQHFKANV